MQAAPAGFEVFDGLNIRVGRNRIMIPDIVVLDQPGLDAVIVELDPVALVIEVTSPSTAWVDRLVKPDAYAGAGISHFLRIDLDRTGPELKDTFPAELDLTVLATATRYPGID